MDRIRRANVPLDSFANVDRYRLGGGTHYCSGLKAPSIRHRLSSAGTVTAACSSASSYSFEIYQGFVTNPFEPLAALLSQRFLGRPQSLGPLRWSKFDFPRNQALRIRSNCGRLGGVSSKIPNRLVCDVRLCIPQQEKKALLSSLVTLHPDSRNCRPQTVFLVCRQQEVNERIVLTKRQYMLSENNLEIRPF